MSSIGARLQTAREEKGLSLDEAWEATRIQKKTLEALEVDDTETLDPAYAKIFLKKYARYLGLDSDAIVEDYLKAHGQLPEPEVSVSPEPPQPASKGIDWQPLVMPFCFGLIALVGIVFLFYLGKDLMQTFKLRSEVERPVVQVDPRKPMTPLVEPFIALSKPLNLKMKVSTDVWLQIKADGEVIYTNTLKAGESAAWDAKQQFEIWTGNASAMSLRLNGKQLGDPGRGVKKWIKINHYGMELPS